MRKIAALKLLLVMSIFVSGCGATVWVKFRGSQDQFVKDVAACSKQSGLEYQEPFDFSPNPFVGVELLSLEGSEKYVKCMEGKGYTRKN
ncbi:MAG: hypothetical protein O2807_00015 [bacterium]|nr:hypothetical protein [bacterium]